MKWGDLVQGSRTREIGIQYRDQSVDPRSGKRHRISNSVPGITESGRQYSKQKTEFHRFPKLDPALAGSKPRGIESSL
ncbi:hypothetical protein E5676_scaffold78665G00030 [Cucumis melo var. makuwa]|uniref:Uncharacterized protein n=1 Tax=Cucumis melo var. makuwa TaxID=1194695 RepID=A0A5D3D6A8_CUCMM|nr:hypothetical protein E5676_scaffold78665G00030 [Cucumis melo var. makuwa]